MYNYEVLKRRLQHIKTTTIKGYDLYDYGVYPFAVEGENDIVVDVLETDNEMYESIKAMELGAGYKEVIVEADEHVGYMYLFDKPTNDPIVEHGDWVKHKTTE